MTVVSGQVAATSSKPAAHDFTPDSEIAKVVLPLPAAVNGKYLVEGCKQLRPCTEAGQVIKLFMDHTLAFLAISGTMGIVDSKGEPYGGGIKFKEQKKPLKTRVFLLQDAHDKPLALCTVDNSDMVVNALQIYGTVPIGNGDKPYDSKYVKREMDTDFYPWFKVLDDCPGLFVSIDYWDGVEFKQFLRGYPDKKEGPVGLMIKSASLHHDLGYMIKVKRGDKSGWDVTIGPGVDPAMMICITAALEDLFGGKNWFKIFE